MYYQRVYDAIFLHGVLLARILLKAITQAALDDKGFKLSVEKGANGIFLKTGFILCFQRTVLMRYVICYT